MNRSRLRPLLILSLCLVGILSAHTSSKAAFLPERVAEHVIVTTADLATSFAPLAQHRSERGLPSTVVTLDWIESRGFAGRDLPERIRTFLQAARTEWGTRFCLLGADAPTLPTRIVESDFYPPGDSEVSLIAVDLYYGALEGDWDANANDVFGEDDDLVDFTPEIAVGRVPVTTGAEADGYVAKVLAYEGRSSRARRRTALLYEVLFPLDWDGSPPMYDAAQDGENLRDLLVASGELEPARIYENHLAYPGATPLNRDSALDALEAGGFGWISAFGHGWIETLSVGADRLEATDLEALTNLGEPFVFFDVHPRSASFDLSCFLEKAVSNPNGGAVAAVGASEVNFITTTVWHMEAFFEEVLTLHAREIGTAMSAARNRFAESAETDGAYRWMAYEWTLLGDPALHLGTPAVTGQIPGIVSRLTLDPARPNPFNPSTTISFRLDGAAVPVRVEVFDLGGHRVRVLWNGILDARQHDFEWDGRDEAGREVGTGTYFGAVTTAFDRRSVKMVLLK